MPYLAELPYLVCKTNVVYKIPLSCGQYCIVQTSHCFNVRLMDHRQLVESPSVQGHLAAHFKRCKDDCVPIYDTTMVISSNKDQKERETLEALLIHLEKQFA